MVHCHVHSSLPLVSIWSLMNPDHTFPSYLRSILILSSHLHLGLSSGLIPSGCPVKALYAFLISSRCSAYFPHLIHCLIILYYVKNQQDATLTVLFISNCKSLYMFRTLSAPIIRSTKNCSSSHWCMSWVGMMYIQ